MTEYPPINPPQLQLELCVNPQNADILSTEKINSSKQDNDNFKGKINATLNFQSIHLESKIKNDNINELSKKSISSVSLKDTKCTSINLPIEAANSLENDINSSDNQNKKKEETNSSAKAKHNCCFMCKCKCKKSCKKNCSSFNCLNCLASCLGALCRNLNSECCGALVGCTIEILGAILISCCK